MSLKKIIMDKLTKDICEYLRLDENMFFCGGHLNYRTCEGRKYFCYIAINEFSIPPNFVRAYMGFAVTSTVARHHSNLRNWIYKYPYTQTTKDINHIIEKCKDYLEKAA